MTTNTTRCGWIFAALVTTLLVSAALPVQAYTTKKTGNGSTIRWDRDALAMRIDPKLYRFMSPGEMQSATAMGSDAWRGLPGVPDVLVSDGEPAPRGYDEGGPTNGMYLVDPWIFEQDKLAVTVTTYKEATGRLLDADVLVNGAADFGLLHELVDRIPGPERFRQLAHRKLSEHYDMGAVLTHEVGHVLGLGEAYETPEATMYPYISRGETHQRTLDVDDEDGVMEIYHNAPAMPAGGCGQAAVGGRLSAQALGWVLAAVGLLWTALRLRARRSASPAAPSVAMGVVLLFGGPIPATQGDPVDVDEPGSAHGASEGMAGARLDPRSPKARVQLDRLFVGAEEIDVGEIAGKGTSRMENGSIYTEHTVRTSGGRTLTLRSFGGTVDGISQRFGELPLPQTDRRVVVARDARGGQRWAYVAEDDALHGGWLDPGIVISDGLAHSER